MKGLFGRHIHLTAKVMDLRLQRQNVVSGNLANLNTPEYKTRRLEFEDRLQKALNQDATGKMTRTDNGHMPSSFSVDGFKGEGLSEFRARHVYGEDSVDLDKEISVMTSNGMMYNTLATVIKKNFSGMQRVIQDGSK